MSPESRRYPVLPTAEAMHFFPALLHVEGNNFPVDFHFTPVSQLEPIVRMADPLIKEDCILASSSDGQFSRPFGRDTYVTAAEKYATYTWFPSPEDEGEQVRVTQAVLGTFRFIATHDLPYAGIENGKHAHEIGTTEEKYPSTWYINEQGLGENYDTLDATDRCQIVTSDIVACYPDLKDSVLLHVEQMLQWSIRNTEEFGGAAYIGAEFDPRRYYPGLTNHRWRDCGYSTVKEDLTLPSHPIYPVEEQALRWAALHRSADLLEPSNPNLSQRARVTAERLRTWFNEQFVYYDEKGVFLADAIDGLGNKLTPVTCDAVLALLPTYAGEAIIDDSKIKRDIIRRTQQELFDPRGGLRTVSRESAVHPKNSYQGNNAFWPHVSAQAVMAIAQEAQRVRVKDPDLFEEYEEYAIADAKAVAGALLYFGSPIETFQIQDNGTIDYYNENVNLGLSTTCRVQAWSGAGGEFVYRYLQKQGIQEVPVPLDSKV